MLNAATFPTPMSQYIDSVGVTNADIGLYRNGNTVVLGTNAMSITTESNPWTDSFYANGFTLTGLSLLDTTSLTIGGTNAFQLFTAYGVTNVDLSPYLLITGTNSLASKAYAASLTNGFVYASITNGLTFSTSGLASQSWVYANSDTNGAANAVSNSVTRLGYVFASVTNGLYLASNPANYVTQNVTNGLYLASNPAGYVNGTITNGLATTGYVTSQGFVTAVVTQGLQSASHANTNNASLSVTNVSLAPYQLQSAANTNNAINSVTNGLYLASNPLGFVTNGSPTNAYNQLLAFSGLIDNTSTSVRSADRLRVVLADTNSTVRWQQPIALNFSNSQTQASVWLINQSGSGTATSVVELACIATANNTNNQSFASALKVNLTIGHSSTGTLQNADILTNAVPGQLWDYRVRWISGATGELSSVILKLGVQ